MTRAEANRFLDRIREGSMTASMGAIHKALVLTGDARSTWDKQPSDPMPGEARETIVEMGSSGTRAIDRVAPGSSTLQP